jgi:hypothetical protein
MSGSPLDIWYQFHSSRLAAYIGAGRCQAYNGDTEEMKQASLGSDRQRGELKAQSSASPLASPNRHTSQNTWFNPCHHPAGHIRG